MNGPGVSPFNTKNLAVWLKCPDLLLFVENEHPSGANGQKLAKAGNEFPGYRKMIGIVFEPNRHLSTTVFYHVKVVGVDQILAMAALNGGEGSREL